jgi:hypothetical protein
VKLILFDGHIHKVFIFHTLKYFNVGTMCSKQNIHSVFYFFPRATQQASIDCGVAIFLCMSRDHRATDI